MLILSILITSQMFSIAVGLPIEMESASTEEISNTTHQKDNKKATLPCFNPGPTYELVTRKEWGARKPVQILPLKVPVLYVVIHHTFIPPACFSQDQCSYAMRTIQSMHVDDKSRGWWDIGYNFGVGGDGAVYEGRGWTVLGAHSLHFNTVSLGIVLIGNWNDTLPPEAQLNAAQALIAAGVAQGFISLEYKLVGHRQVRPTECPGQALYEHIAEWPRFDPTLNLAADFKENIIAVKDDKKST